MAAARMSHQLCKLSVVRANPMSDSSQQFRAISIILPEVQPLPGMLLIVCLSNWINEWINDGQTNGLM